MIILLGTARAITQESGFRPTSLHAVLAVVDVDDLASAEKVIINELCGTGWGEVRFQKSARISSWQSFAPTSRGKELRRARLQGYYVNIYEDEEESS